MRFRDWKLGKKYGVGVGIILILMAAGFSRSFRQLVSLKSDLEAVSRNWLGRIIAVSEINRHASDLRMWQLQYASVSDTNARAAQVEGIVALIDRIIANIDTYEMLRTESRSRSVFVEQEESLYAVFDHNWDQYQAHSLTLIELSMSGRNSEAVQLLSGEAQVVFDSMSASLLGLVEMNKSYALGAADRAESSLQSLRHASLLLFLITIGISAVFSFWLARVISRPIRRLATAAESVATGNLTVQLAVDSKDEVGQLGSAFNRMTTALREARERSDRQRENIEQANRDLQTALDQLQEAQDQLILQEKMASLGKLVAGVSHELNTPTGALLSANDVTGRIVSRLRAVRDALPGAMDSDIRKKLDSLLQSIDGSVQLTHEAGKRIQEIVTSLRNFVHLDEADYQVTDLKEGLESSVTLLGSDLLSRIEIVREYSDIPRVACFPGQINQVFYNVLRNAADAIDGRGRITIKTVSTPDNVTIQILDTGRGIAPSRLNRIFEVGWKAQGERVRMGSGIVTAYNVIRRHGGEFTIESALGKGTTVTIQLPLIVRPA
jgi:signal transduction histidine kinase